MLTVAAQTQQTSHNELRTASGPGFAHRGAHHFEAGPEIRPVHQVAVDAVAGSFIEQRATGELPLGGS